MMKKYKIKWLCLAGLAAMFQNAGAQTTFQATVPVFKNIVFIIVDYGAKTNGIFLNTESINRAIAVCSKQGGGTALIPAGLRMSGPVILKSTVNLQLSKNCFLRFSSDINQYALVRGNWEGRPAIRNQIESFALSRWRSIAVSNSRHVECRNRGKKYGYLES